MELKDWFLEQRLKVRNHFLLTNKITNLIDQTGKARFRFDQEIQKREIPFYKTLLEESLKNFLDPSTIELVVESGCRNWSYLPALLEVFKNAHFHGIEVDTKGIGFDGKTRIDQARMHVAHALFQGRFAWYWDQDFTDWEHKKNEATNVLYLFLFPFVTKEACQKWGLPSRFSSFEKQLEKILAIKNAYFISTHMGPNELEKARLAYDALGIKTQMGSIKATEVDWPLQSDVYILKGFLEDSIHESA